MSVSISYVISSRFCMHFTVRADPIENVSQLEILSTLELSLDSINSRGFEYELRELHLSAVIM